MATGKLAEYRCTFAEIAETDEGLTLDPVAAAAISVSVGDKVWFVGR